jgi:hypothetical protein
VTPLNLVDVCGRHVIYMGHGRTYIMQFWLLEKSVSYKFSESFGLHSLSDGGQIFIVASLNGR